ncbi:helix-turn-helix domain-containing protein, partial [Fischerella thermalis CCMEE 5328]
VSDINKSVNLQQVQIGLTLTEKSWIQVLVDGKVEYEGELPEGTHKTWKAQEQLTVRTNNAGGVLVSINKEKAKQLGEPGKQKEVTIAANTRF